jgi:hypothetical protein
VHHHTVAGGAPVTQGVLQVAIGFAFAPLPGLTGATRARLAAT